MGKMGARARAAAEAAAAAGTGADAAAQRNTQGHQRAARYQPAAGRQPAALFQPAVRRQPSERSRFALALTLAAAIAGPLGAGSALARGTARAEAAPVVQVAATSRADLKQQVAAAVSDIRRDQPRRIWCVPFARAVSGIDIRGDAWTWWHKAGSDYPKGRVPVSGAVLNFRATGQMPLGHVAVVSQVVDSRRILVDQANWVTNRITLDTQVVDVSARNDWSQVRVENQQESFGRVYPTYGFIYRPAGDAS